MTMKEESPRTHEQRKAVAGDGWENRSEERFVDKSSWLKGPWLDEPDRIEWRHAGFPCLIARGPIGPLCGYVGLPPGHPMHGKGYDDVHRSDGQQLEHGHGGLTYAAECQPPPGKICHVPREGEPEDVWWVGFDCAHFGDYTDMRGMFGGISDGDDNSGRGAYRDLDYVRRDVEGLAAELVVP